MNECRPEASLQFLAGEMSDADITAFEAHVEVCHECQRRLEQSVDQDGLLAVMRKLIPPLSSHHSYRKMTESSSAALSAHGPWNPQYTTATVLALLAPSEDPAVAGRLGQYDILGIVGRGSAGIVLKGFDRNLHRNIAIKILDPALADVTAARLRFGREAKAMAAVSCDHVVPIFEVSEHAGLPYFVMEYVPGGSLERRLQNAEPIDVVVAVRIGMQVALALAAAHAQGLVHRDIKPGNILLDRGTERVRVADFGLARAVNDASCTRSGFVTGTPQYMAPEQVRGEPCDGLSDLFSLGAVLYVLCTGHPPFQADSVYGVMQCVVHDQPRSIRKQNPLVPEWLEDLILRLLSKPPTDRFESAEVVARLLEQELAHLQDTRTAPPARTWRKPPGRRRGRGAIVFSAATLIALFYILFPWRQIGEPRSSINPHPYPVPQTAAGDASTSQFSRLAPHWNHDGTSELQAAIKRVRNEWTAGTNDLSVVPELFHNPAVIRQQLAALRQQFQDVKPVTVVAPAEPTSPFPTSKQ